MAPSEARCARQVEIAWMVLRRSRTWGYVVLAMCVIAPVGAIVSDP